MPKEKKVSVGSRLRSFIKEHSKNVLTTNGKVLRCVPCDMLIDSDYKISVVQHMSTKGHLEAIKRKGMSDSGSVGDGHTQQAGAARLSRGASRNTSLRNSKEDVSKGNDPNTGGNKIEEIPAVGQDATGVTIECAVCLQTCVHPVKLPCSHIFCFLCVKGVAFQSRRCAMCRQEIPSDVLLHPQLVDRTQLEKESVLEDGYQWFYEGRNGWWKYDERTTADLEEVYNKGQETTVELLIAGASYVVDFKRLVQYPKYRPGRIRKIRRGGGQDDPAASALPKLGVAGIRFS